MTAASYRWSVASRVLAAVLGGYLLTSALATLLALLLPVLLRFEPAHAVMAASDVGVLFYLPILMWSFHTRSATRAWGWLLLWTAAALAANWALGAGGAP